MTGSSVAWSRTFRMGQTADTTGQSSSDVFQWFSMEGDIDALDVAEHEHVDSEELAEIEQVVSQARCANRSKGLESDAQRDVW